MSDRFRPFRFSRAGLRGLRASATLSLNERVRTMWESGRAVYHLGFGESRFPVHPKVAEALKANVHQRSYLPTLGIRELREKNCMGLGPVLSWGPFHSGLFDLLLGCVACYTKSNVIIRGGSHPGIKDFHTSKSQQHT